MISESGRSKRCARASSSLQREREVARVEEPGLRVDARLRLQLRHRERAVDQEERRERERDQPRVRVPEGGERDAEHREHELGREALEGEEARLAHRVPAGEPEHRREQHVVDADEHGAAARPASEPQVGRVRPWPPIAAERRPRRPASRACSSRC